MIRRKSIIRTKRCPYCRKFTYKEVPVMGGKRRKFCVNPDCPSKKKR